MGQRMSFLLFLSLLQLLAMWRFAPPVFEDTTGHPGPMEIMNKLPVNDKHQELDPPGDGTFNGINIYYRETPRSFQSEVRCVGENFRNDSWQSRSCEFRNICFNTKTKKFVLFRSPKNRDIGIQHDDRTTISTTFSNKSVAIGSFTYEQIEKHGFEKMKWFPEIEDDLPQYYYELPSDYVLVPFHGLAPHNPGHLVWDNFLPIHTLLSTFELQDRRLLLMRVVIEYRLFGTCEALEWLPPVCNAVLHKFLVMMGNGVNETFSSNYNFNVTQSKSKSDYVCANTGVAGLGMMTDHGLRSHGYHDADYETVRFAGRAPIISAFRNFVFDNMGLRKGTAGIPPYRITFSTHSSGHALRGTAFGEQIKAVNHTYEGNETVVVQEFCFADYSVREQLKIASQTNIYISAAGGGAVTATFLPPGASAIIYYNQEGGVKARLDWEVLNNAGYFTTNWLALEDYDSKTSLEKLLEIIRFELERISRF